MAHNIEPMDIDNIEENFDNKENSFHQSNVLPRTPCTEKGYEELDVSELNMKLRYSITPASSPMSKSYTAHCLDNRNSDCPENIANSVDNANLTRSFNSTLTRNDLSKSAKLQPLQLHMTEPSLDNNRNTSVLRPLETTISEDDKNITVTVTEANDIDENLSIPSSSSSALHTPEATTPTKEMPRKDGGSPIMRGLKSVLNMFRASQSPIPPSESENYNLKHDISSPVDVASCNTPSDKSQAALASTPIMARKQKESSSKRGSPLKESIVFNEDLEKELLWKDETTILFSEEKIPIHKLFFQQSKNDPSITKENEKPAVPDDSLNDTVEFMDVSYNDSVLKNKTNIAESDSEFVDCETTFTQLSDDEQILKDDEKKITSAVNNVSEHSQTLNKTVEELQKTTEECDSKALDITVSKEGPAAVTQVIYELDDKNIEEPVDSTDDIQTEIYAEETKRNSERIKTQITENVKESLHSTITLQSEVKPLIEAKLKNVTQDIKTEMPNIIKKTLDSTVEVIVKDKNVSSELNNEIESIEINTENVGQSLDETVILQSGDKPQTSPTLINVTKDIKTEMPNDMTQTLDATVTVLEDKQLSSSVINKAIDSVKINTEIETKINIQNLKEPLDGTVILQSEDKPLTSPTLMNVTQDIRTEMLNDMTQALDATINVTEDKSLSSSVMNNAIQSIEVTSSIDDIKALDTTVSIDSIEKRMSVSNFIMNATQNVTQLSADTLNTTDALDDKPVSASTFIMNATQNIDSTSVVENVNEDPNVIKELSGKPVMSSTFIMNSTQCNKSQSNPEILNQNITVSIQNDEAGINIQDLEIQPTTDDIEKSLDAAVTVSSVDTAISSSTFVMNSSKNNDISLAKQNELLDATVTIDSKDDTSASITSSTFIKDVTNDIESQKSGEFGVVLDATLMLESQNKSISSSTFVKDVTQDIEKEPLDGTIISAPIGVSDDRNNFYTTLSNEAIEQAATYTLPTKDVEISATSECLDVLLSADKSGSSSIDFKDITNQIIDPAVVNDCINALDITLDTKEDDQHTNFEEITSVNDKQLPNDVLKPFDGTLPIEVSQPAALSIEDDTQTEINNETTCQREIAVTGELSMEYSSAVHQTVEFIEDEKKQLNSNEGISNEIISEQVDKAVFKPMNPDILENSENVANLLSGNTEVQVSTIDGTTNKLRETYEVSSGDYLPANIPLPDEDDLEVVQSKAAQDSVINNAANSSVLPDVVNDLDSSKIQNATRIDQVPVNILDHVKTADLITDSLAINDQVIDANRIKDKKVITEYTDGIDNHTKKICELSHNIIEKKEEDMLNNIHEKLSLPEHPIDSVLHVENNVDQRQKLTEIETKRINLVDQPESMDISYNTHDVSVHNKSEVAASHNITTALNKIESSDPNGINVTEEKSNVGACPEVKIDSITVVPMTLSDINKVSVKDMEINLEASGIAKKTETMESFQTAPTSKNDKETKKELIHEEIIVSENNSPYVFVSVDKITENKFGSSIEEDFEKIENPFAGISKVSPTPPTSPPIASKGYNFNFDEIDDPFATKTKIRTSPPADSPKQTILEKQEVKREPLNKNKRKSYPVRPKPVTTKKNFNTTCDGTLSSSSGSIKKSESITQNILREDSKNSSTEDAEINVVEKSELEINTDNTSKLSVETQNTLYSLTSKSSDLSTTPSSSDQSIYLSAGTSSGGSITARNVFNLPEIDDMNFNPFATKAKIRQSPPPSLDVSEAITNDYSDTAKVAVDEMLSHNLSHQNKSGPDEKDSSNASNTTTSSKDDKNTTVREVHTDDDDTVEGPFLEAEDNEMPWIGHHYDTKNSGFDGLNVKSDMMQFSDLPAQDNEDNELFIDAATFEFLLNQNKSNVVADSGKESLFLKFDPLFAKRLSSEGIAAALSNFQKRQSTPKKMSRPSQVANAEQSVPGPSPKISPPKLNNTEDIAEDLNVTISKPMMVVTPAVNPIVTPRKSTTPTSNYRRSIAFTSPAIAVIDRLLSLSANNSLVDQNTTITQTNREQNEAELALTQLRELLAEKEINVCTLRSESKELKDRLTSLESQMNVLEAESEERLIKVNELTDKLNEKTKINKSMAAVVEEYERTIASLIAETEQDRKQHGEERARLIAERDEQTAHLASMEVSFSDLHSKYEKSKQIILTCKANEDTYKKSIKAFEENLAKMQTNYETLKQHATSKLNHANQELEKMNRAHESEVLKLNAMIKRKELHITSLEETLAQKTKANEELTAICDELINKVG